MAASILRSSREGGREGPFSQGRTCGGGEGQGNPSDKAGWMGRGCPTPTSDLMMSDSARAFPSQGQRPIEHVVGLECLGPGEERGLVPGLCGVDTEILEYSYVTAFSVCTNCCRATCPCSLRGHLLSGCELKAVPWG